MSPRLAVLAAAASLLVVPAFAQSTSTPAPTSPTRGEPQSSNMSPPAGNQGAANNGVGTAGSITGNNGSASSTVQSGNSATAAGASGNNRGASGPLENDPALGGGTQK